MQSISENDFECFARTGVNTSGTMFPDSVPANIGFRRSRLLAQNIVARMTELVGAFYGVLPATTPMLATVSPFFIEGTAQTYRTTPLDGARASHTVLPNRSVT